MNAIPPIVRNTSCLNLIKTFQQGDYLIFIVLNIHEIYLLSPAHTPARLAEEPVLNGGRKCALSTRGF